MRILISYQLQELGGAHLSKWFHCQVIDYSPELSSMTQRHPLNASSECIIGKTLRTNFIDIKTRSKHYDPANVQFDLFK
jgi:hypothetical protein